MISIVFKAIAGMFGGSSFWDDSGIPNTVAQERADCIKGMAIYIANEKKKKDQYYIDLKKELDSNLNPKSW